ncbi:phosphonate C-P lyase system protein PhnG [Methylobacterium aerolatum]|uniref:Alpha-D-ribose 1-methylphosphonate 5-triphosphate synthase subunit PhnG n=1 Tax=Methylobacterium aerolatum TaxID=418708 RepID=A0ABU0I1K3_9HYPH|nr:phosphonate C-P lyase system protein PhnG [Methylobacterium aerolatum]MDQ0448475.1 alpha-D-ribose 1-methylphosphonate 5-triphosphate synthase subunit PhnG [Methylobacterium aerolatum]GJD34556.1 Alpha-D-ribose 1-methylphosphonate 5-triphosphate synthase subunit PhnG [Methylobacterium aerolatum]
MPDRNRGTVQDPEIESRRAVMALCAAATEAELAEAVTACGEPEAEDIRLPEVGLVMATGRIGGDGRPFNLGEVSVTRAAVRLADGRTGFAYHLGRDRRRARVAAILDALWQGEGDRRGVEAALAGIARRTAEATVAQARRTAATRVDFLTLARGED